MEKLEFDRGFMDSTTAIEELDRKRKRMLYRGIPLFFAFPLSLSLLFILPHVVPDVVIGSIVILGFILTIVGMSYVAFIPIWQAYVRVLRVLQQLSPPEPRINEKYGVTKFENTYIFALKSAPYALYFVAFEHTEPAMESKIDVPKTFWKWNSALHIEGLRVHNRQGTFTIPTPEGEYLSGEGNLLLIPLKRSSYMIHVPDFSRDHLLAVAEYASNLASGENAVV
ncbi:MAG: hypothetical protein ACFFCP_01495 [Promethearchaeota archaeon]